MEEEATVKKVFETEGVTGESKEERTSLLGMWKREEIDHHFLRKERERSRKIEFTISYTPALFSFQSVFLDCPGDALLPVMTWARSTSDTSFFSSARTGWWRSWWSWVSLAFLYTVSSHSRCHSNSCSSSALSRLVNLFLKTTFRAKVLKILQHDLQGEVNGISRPKNEEKVSRTQSVSHLEFDATLFEFLIPSGKEIVIRSLAFPLQSSELNSFFGKSSIFLTAWYPLNIHLFEMQVKGWNRSCFQESIKIHFEKKLLVRSRVRFSWWRQLSCSQQRDSYFASKVTDKGKSVKKNIHATLLERTLPLIVSQ